MQVAHNLAVAQYFAGRFDSIDNFYDAAVVVKRRMEGKDAEGEDSPTEDFDDEVRLCPYGTITRCDRNERDGPSLVRLCLSGSRLKEPFLRATAATHLRLVTIALRRAACMAVGDACVCSGSWSRHMLEASCLRWMSG